MGSQSTFIEEELQAGQEVALGDVETAVSRDHILSAAGDGDRYKTARQLGTSEEIDDRSADASFIDNECAVVEAAVAEDVFYVCHDVGLALPFPGDGIAAAGDVFAGFDDGESGWVGFWPRSRPMTMWPGFSMVCFGLARLMAPCRLRLAAICASVRMTPPGWKLPCVVRGFC